MSKHSRQKGKKVVGDKGLFVNLMWHLTSVTAGFGGHQLRTTWKVKGRTMGIKAEKCGWYDRVLMGCSLTAEIRGPGEVWFLEWALSPVFLLNRFQIFIAYCFHPHNGCSQAVQVLQLSAQLILHNVCILGTKKPYNNSVREVRVVRHTGMP